MTVPPDDAPGRAEGRLDAIASWLRPASRRRWYGRAAVLLFFGVAVASAWRLPPVDLDWAWLGVVVAMLLVSVSLLAAEYRLAGRLAERRVAWGEAFRVTILSSAANLLPVPGGLVVRTGALRRKGSQWSAALGSNVVMGLGWLGVALLLAGALLHGHASPTVAGSFVVFGLLVLSGMWIGIAQFRKGRAMLRFGGRVILLEAMYVLGSALRLFAVLAGLGIEVTFPQATALTVASALAAGVGFFPGGLGLRELLAGGLSPLVGLAPAVGAFAGVVDRIAGLVVRGLLTAILWRWGRGRDLPGDDGEA